MIQPQLAPVKPRVQSPQSGDAVPLEDEIRPFVEAGMSGAIRISGPAGSGKTTALQHLAAVLPQARHVHFLDDPALPDMGLGGGLIIYTSESTVGGSLHLASFQLSPWTSDEVIEYLLAAHKSRCASVMRRLQIASERGLFADQPEVWRLVLDEMAADATLPNARSALLHYLHTHLADPEAAKLAGGYCLACLVDDKEALPNFLRQLRHVGCGASVRRVLRHAAVQTLLAAEQIAQDLQADACPYFDQPLPRGLIREAAARVATDRPALEHLTGIVEKGHADLQAMAASILHATATGWVPRQECLPRLSGAYLDGVVWPGAGLVGAVLSMADLSDADLHGARLDHAQARKTCFRNATLHSASLQRLHAVGADFRGADLSFVRAENADFYGADLERASLEGASLRGASLQGINVKSARFVLADLGEAKLSMIALAGADFTRASFEKAHLLDVDLRPARLDGTTFTGASLTHCNLEGLELPGADFQDADLFHALLTGSIMPEANFRNASLRNTGLAEIAWERADLRDADLRGASFHMGTTRSGLVGSFLASEGTRTGFYTDDYSEQDFKAPEEIRKANLCGADLRGAHVLDVDFYLVDLRGALYDPAQAEHFRRCGAILEDRS